MWGVLLSGFDYATWNATIARALAVAVYVQVGLRGVVSDVSLYAIPVVMKSGRVTACVNPLSIPVGLPPLAFTKDVTTAPPTTGVMLPGCLVTVA
jgi:hypothetical protein